MIAYEKVPLMIAFSSCVAKAHLHYDENGAFFIELFLWT